jgi:hypothetical protein
MKSHLALIRIGSEAFFVYPYNPLDLVDALNLLMEPQEEEPFQILIAVVDESIPEFYFAVLKHAGIPAMAMTDPMKVLDALSNFQLE